MKITKLVHSCLLVEDQDQVVLIDPGMFSTDALNKANIKQLDQLLITHEHADHFDIDNIKQLVKKFPELNIIANDSIVSKLAEAGIKSSNQDNKIASMQVVQHEDLWGDNHPPLNGIFTVFSRLTHPGDKLNLTRTTEILALPIFAPWGSFKWAMETALKLKPKYIIPIHDWFLSDPAKQWHHERAHETLDSKAIEFVDIENGVSVEL